MRAPFFNCRAARTILKLFVAFGMPADVRKTATDTETPRGRRSPPDPNGRAGAHTLRGLVCHFPSLGTSESRSASIGWGNTHDPCSQFAIPPSTTTGQCEKNPNPKPWQHFNGVEALAVRCVLALSPVFGLGPARARSWRIITLHTAQTLGRI